MTFNELLLVSTNSTYKIEHILCINSLRCTFTLWSPEKINQNICFMYNFCYCVINLKCIVAQAITNSCGRSRKSKATLYTNVNII